MRRALAVIFHGALRVIDAQRHSAARPQLHRLILTIGVLLVIVVACVAAVFWFERALLFPKPMVPHDDAAWLRAGAKRLLGPWSEGGPSEVWWLPPLLPSAGPASLLVFAQGTVSSSTHGRRIRRAARLRPWGPLDRVSRLRSLKRLALGGLHHGSHDGRLRPCDHAPGHRSNSHRGLRAVVGWGSGVRTGASPPRGGSGARVHLHERSELSASRWSSRILGS